MQFILLEIYAALKELITSFNIEKMITVAVCE